MNDRRRLLSSATFAAVAALVFFLPQLISSPLILPLLNRQLNHDLTGQLELRSCSFRWSGGLSCRDVRYTDSQRALRVQMPHVSTDKGLFTLLVAPQYLGKVTLKQPTLTFLQQGGPRNQVHSYAPQAERMSGQQLPISWWEERGLRFQIQGGQIVADQGVGKNPRVLARELKLSGDLALGTVNYVLELQSAEAAGRFHAQGFINLPIAGQPFLSSLVSQSTLDFQSMEIEPILDLASSRIPNVPLGKGILNGACQLDLAGIDNLVIKGQASLNDLELHGGVLGKDQPRLRQAQLTFEGSRHPTQGWRLSQLELQSDPLTFSVHGLLDRRQVDFIGQGQADLPQLTGALPHLFAIHDQTRIHKGSLDFAFQAKGPLDRVDLQADCDSQRLEVTQAGHPYAWENPLSLHVAATLGATGGFFNHFQFKAPSLTVEGQGGLEEFVLEATADLDRFFFELEKVFSLNLHAKGHLALTLRSNRLQQDLRSLNSQLRIENFGLESQGQTLLPAHPFSVQGELIGKPWFLPRTGLQSLRLAVDGWPGTFALFADRLQEASSGQNGSVGENCRISTDLNLQRLAQVVRIIQGRKETLGVQGQLQAEARGEWHQSLVHLRQLKGQIQHFVFASGDTIVFREPQIDVSVEQSPLRLGTLHVSDLQIVERKAGLAPASEFCRIDLQSPLGMEVQGLRFRSPQAIVDVQGSLGQNPNSPTGVVLNLRGLGDLHLLSSWGRHIGWIGDGIEAKGQTLASLIAHPAAGEQPGSTECMLQIKDLSLRKGDKRFYDDPKVVLDLELQPEGKGGKATKISRFKLQSSQFSFAGAGVAHHGQGLPYIDLQGELRPSVAGMQQVLQSLAPGKVILEEMEPGKILFSAPLHFPVESKDLTLSGQLGAKKLRYLGIDLSPVTVPIDFNRSTLEVQIKGQSNGGEVSLYPKWQQGGKSLRMFLEADSQVLNQLPITKAVADELLAELPPLGCLVQATGTMGLKITRFSLPLSVKRRQPDFAVVIDLENARPKAVSALKQLLQTADLAKSPLRFQERELICEGWNGSITCAPLRLKAGAWDVRISGSKRRDGQIAYKVELPVTKALTSKAGVSVYGNFSAVADITGTQENPVFDQTAFFQGLAAQITAALPKPLMNAGAVPVGPKNTDSPAASAADN